jgi:hypothetical protein
MRPPVHSIVGSSLPPPTRQQREMSADGSHQEAQAARLQRILRRVQRR